MYYLIRESLVLCSADDIVNADVPFVCVLGTEEWKSGGGRFGIETDMEMEMSEPRETKAVVNMNSLTGTFFRPSLTTVSGFGCSFSFALDERGVVLVDDSGYAAGLVGQICRTKKWRLPGLERFLYDLLETAIAGDLAMLENVEKKLNAIEMEIMKGELAGYPDELNDIRGDLLDLKIHYEQLIDLGQELTENENEFFRENTLRYFHMITERAVRLQNLAAGEREYVVQLRDLMQAKLEERQNTIMTVLTVITTIFLPLTLIAGWYGMNFANMPELEWRYGYPVIIIISAAVIAATLIWFKKKKWM